MDIRGEKNRLIVLLQYFFNLILLDLVYFSCLDIWISQDQQNVLALGWCSFWRATTKFCWFRVLRTWGTKFILKQVQVLKWIDNQNWLTRAMWWKSQLHWLMINIPIDICQPIIWWKTNVQAFIFYFQIELIKRRLITQDHLSL